MEKYLKKNWNVILSVLIGLAILIFGIFKEHSKTEATRDAAIAFLISLLITFLHRLNTYLQHLEDNQDIVSKFIKLLSKSPKLRDTVTHTFEASSNENQFYKFFLSQVHEEYNKQLYQISQGNFSCNPEAELTITKTILECCNKSLKAISYEDEQWWHSNNGILYLEAHNKYIERKKEKATRIFIIKKAEFEGFIPILQKHKELDIEVYYLFSDVDKIDDKYKIDFVIYDDFMLRRAFEVKNVEGGKNAFFTSEAVELRKYLNLFNDLLTIAKIKSTVNIIPD